MSNVPAASHTQRSYLPFGFSSFAVSSLGDSFLSIFMKRIQSPSEGVGNWQVVVVTTATAGLFSPVRGLTQVTLGEVGMLSSLTSTVRSSGTYTTIRSRSSDLAAAMYLGGDCAPGLFTIATGAGRSFHHSMPPKKSATCAICSAAGMVMAFCHGKGVPV